MNSDFIDKIKNDLIKKNVSESSINLYIRNLQKISENNNFNNLNFLKSPDVVLNKLEKYKENTKRNYIISIVAILTLYKDKYKKMYAEYSKIMKDMNDKFKNDISKNEKSDTQKKNWIEWDEVMTKYNELNEEVDKFINNKKINEIEYNKLLQFVILSLYTLIPPRRNLDYIKCNIIKKYDGDKDVNYYSIDDSKFIFNIFKTAKKEGMITVDTPDKLNDVLNKYFKFHPLIKGKINKKTNAPFLVDFNGEKLNNVNMITKILNKIFDKKISSSMLRHIYLSDKFGKISDDKKNIAKAMSHSVDMQNDYIKND